MLQVQAQQQQARSLSPQPEREHPESGKYIYSIYSEAPAAGLTSVRPPAEAFKHGVLELHNSLRARHGVPFLSWSSECEAHAQLQVPHYIYCIYIYTQLQVLRATLLTPTHAHSYSHILTSIHTDGN